MDRHTKLYTMKVEMKNLLGEHPCLKDRAPGDALDPDFIRRGRKILGWKQQELATRIGRKTAQTVNNWEKGRQKCTGSCAEVLLLLFQRKALTPTDLLDEDFSGDTARVWSVFSISDMELMMIPNVNPMQLAMNSVPEGAKILRIAALPVTNAAHRYEVLYEPATSLPADA